MKRDDPQTNVRIPAALKEWISESAKQRGISFTAELVRRLELTFTTDYESLGMPVREPGDEGTKKYFTELLQRMTDVSARLRLILSIDRQLLEDVTTEIARLNNADL